MSNVLPVQNYHLREFEERERQKWVMREWVKPLCSGKIEWMDIKHREISNLFQIIENNAKVKALFSVI